MQPPSRSPRSRSLVVACRRAGAAVPGPTTTAASATSFRRAPTARSTRTDFAPVRAAAAPIPRTRPTSSSMYENLVYATPGLTAAQIPNFFKDASFGVQPGRRRAHLQPARRACTIVRDATSACRTSTASPAPTRSSAPATSGAEDRLFFMDVLRHAGPRRSCPGFAGGANKAMDADVWAIAPYTEADLQEQIDKADDLYGAEGAAAPAGPRRTTSPASTSTSPRPARTRPRCPTSTRRSARRSTTGRRPT